MKKFARRTAIAAALTAGLVYARARLRAASPDTVGPDPVVADDEEALSPDEELHIVQAHNRFGREELQRQIDEAAARDARGEGCWRGDRNARRRVGRKISQGPGRWTI